MKGAEERWQGVKRTMQTALADVIKAFGQTLFDQRFHGVIFYAARRRRA